MAKSGYVSAPIKTDETEAAHTKCLRVHDPSLRIEFIFDAGERGPKFGHKNFEHPPAALRRAKGDIIWQGEGVQLISLHHLKFERNGGVGVAHQVLAEPVDILADSRIVKHLGLLPHLLGKLLA